MRHESGIARIDGSPSAASRGRRLGVRGAIVGAVHLACLMASSRGAASPQESLEVHVESASDRAAEGCTRADVELAVAKRTRRPVRFVEEARTTLRVQFIVSPPSETVEAEISFDGVSGRETRRLKTSSCEDAASALSLVAATWLEAEPSTRIEDAPPGPAPAPPIGAPIAAASNVTPRETGPVAIGGDASRFLLGGHVTSTPGVVSSWLPGAPLTTALRVRSHGELRAGLRGALAEERGAKGQAALFWATVPLDVCLDTGRAKPYGASLCARAEPGIVRIGYDGQSHVLPWFGLGPGARLRWELGGVGLEAEAFLPLQVLGYSIRSDGPSLETVRTFAGSFAVGAMLPIP